MIADVKAKGAAPIVPSLTARSIPGCPADGARGMLRAMSQPVDLEAWLRAYVQRHGGKFPVNDWLAVIQDARPGGVHAKVWRTIKQGQTGAGGKDAAARGVLGSIARYIMSVQTK